MLLVQELWWATVAWLVPLALVALDEQDLLPLPVLPQGAGPLQWVSPESTAESGGWGEWAAQLALFTGSKMCISVLGHSNGNGWSSRISWVKCTCVASPMCKGKSGQLGRLVSPVTWGISKGNFSKRTLDSLTTERIWLEREAGKEGASLSNACVTVSLGDTGPLTGTSLSLIYCRLNEKCFDILHLLLCHVGNKIVKGLPGFLWQAPYLWHLIFLPVQLQMA